MHIVASCKVEQVLRLEEEMISKIYPTPKSFCSVWDSDELCLA